MMAFNGGSFDSKCCSSISRNFTISMRGTRKLHRGCTCMDDIPCIVSDIFSKDIGFCLSEGLPFLISISAVLSVFAAGGNELQNDILDVFGHTTDLRTRRSLAGSLGSS